MKIRKNLIKVGLGLFLALSGIAAQKAPLTGSSGPTPNDTSAYNCNLPNATEAVVIPYDGDATSAYGVQGYAGLKGPAWIVEGNCGEWSPHINGDTSHRLGSNAGDGRSGLELTFKFDSTVAGEAKLNLYMQHESPNSNALLNENGKYEQWIDLGALGCPAWECAQATSIIVTVNKGINTYKLTMQNSYTAWFATFSLDQIDLRNPDTDGDISDITTTYSPTIGYYGNPTKIYGFEAYAQISGQSWTCGNADIFSRLQDGSKSHSIGSSTGDQRSGLTFKLHVNSNKAGFVVLDLFVKISQYDKASKINVKVNDNPPSTWDLCNLQPVEWNYERCTQVDIYLAAGDNEITITAQDNYTLWFGGFRIGPDDTARAQHDPVPHDYNITNLDPVTVDYTGGVSEHFSFQEYVGVKGGEVWVTGDSLPYSAGHKIGGNADKAATDFTFKINSTVAGAVKLLVYVEHYIDASLAQYKAEVGGNLKVNDGDPTPVNFYDLTGTSGSVYDAVPMDITLVKGENTIVLSMVEHYKAWFGSFQIGGTYDMVGIGNWTNKQGYMNADQYAIGLNAWDNSGDYGKEGSVDYVFYTDKAGLYDLNMNVMAGAKFGSRVQFKVNGEVVMFEGKDYYEFPTDGGWSYVYRTVRVRLPQGKVTLTIGNKLATLSADKEKEVAEGSEGSIKCSNWWINSLEIVRVLSKELVLDTSNVQLLFNQGRQFNYDGLVVKVCDHALEDYTTVLSPSEYVVDSSEVDIIRPGSYKVYVTCEKYNLEASYRVSIGGNDLTKYKGDVLDFDGEHEAKQSFYYTETIGEGSDECAGRLAWILGEQTDAGDNGLKLGSRGVGSSENRQITFKLHINSKRSGKFLLSVYALTDGVKQEIYEHCTYKVSVNGGEETTKNLLYTAYDKPFRMMVELVRGENVVTIKSPNQYWTWWSHYTISPLYAPFAGTEQIANRGMRDGNDEMNTEANTWLASTNKRSLSFAYTVTRNQDYEFSFESPDGANKKAEVLLDGQKVSDVSLVQGVNKVHFSLIAGVHIITINCNGGAETSFSVTKVNLDRYLAIKGLILNTQDVTTTIENGGIVSYSELKVTAVYSNNSRKELDSTQFTVTKPENMNTKVAGTYTYTVTLNDDPAISATFNVIVKEYVEPVEPVDSGCKGSVSVALSGLIVAGLGLAVLSLKKKEDK